MIAYARTLIAIGVIGAVLSCGRLVLIGTSHGAADMPKKIEPMFVAPDKVGNLYYHAPDCIYIDPAKPVLQFYSRHEAQAAAELLPAPCCLKEGGQGHTSESSRPPARAQTRRSQSQHVARP